MSHKRAFRRLVFVVIGAICFCWALFNYHLVFELVKFIYGLVFPFVLGGSIAFILNLPLRSIEKLMTKIFTTKKHKPKKQVIRILSLILTLLVVIGIVCGIIGVIIPLVGQTINDVTSEIPRFIINCQRFLQNLSLKMPDFAEVFNELSFDWPKIVNGLTNVLRTVGSTALSSSITLATGVFGGIVNFILAFIFAMYLLSEKEKISEFLINLLYIYAKEKVYVPIINFCKLSDVTFSNFVSGQCIEACILGVLIFIGMLIFSFPYAALISVVVAITALIPVFGAFAAGVLGALLIMIHSPTQALWFILMFFVVQQLEGNIIYPRVVGRKIGLPPMLVLVAVTVGGGLFGIFGMLIFIPLFSVVFTLFSEYTQSKAEKINKKVCVAEEQKS